jgi:hypothetical protein
VWGVAQIRAPITLYIHADWALPARSPLSLKERGELVKERGELKKERGELWTVCIHFRGLWSLFLTFSAHWLSAEQ